MMIKNNANFNHGTPKATTKLKPKPKSNAKPKASLTEVQFCFYLLRPTLDRLFSSILENV